VTTNINKPEKEGMYTCQSVLHMSQLLWSHSKLKSWLANAKTHNMQIYRGSAMQELPKACVYFKIKNLLYCKRLQKYTPQTVHNPQFTTLKTDYCIMVNQEIELTRMNMCPVVQDRHCS